jgi:dihydroneopterin aldolase
LKGENINNGWNKLYDEAIASREAYAAEKKRKATEAAALKAAEAVAAKAAAAIEAAKLNIEKPAEVKSEKPTSIE